MAGVERVGAAIERQPIRSTPGRLVIVDLGGLGFGLALPQIDAANERLLFSHRTSSGLD